MVNNNQKVWLRTMSVLVAALWVVLGLVNAWPVWVWILLAVISLAAPSLLVIALTEWALHRRVPAEEPEVVPAAPPPPPRPEPPRPQSFHVNDVLLASVREDYQFLFTCTVFWLPCGNEPGLPHAQPGASAADAILYEVTQVAATVRPEDVSRAQYQVMSMLGVPRIDRTGRVQAWADHISLRLAEEDADRIKRLSEVRKEEEVWEYERSYERNVRSYLGDDVLTSTGSALVWWLAGPRTNEKKRVNEAVEHIANLRQLTRTATDTVDTAEPGRSDVLGFAHEEFRFDHEGFGFAVPEASDLRQLPLTPVSAFASNGNGDAPTEEPEVSLGEQALNYLARLPDNAERALLARQLADHLRAQGFDDDAASISRRFDAPSSQSSDESQQADRADDGESGALDDIEGDGGANGAEQDDEQMLDQTSRAQDSESDDPDPGSASAAFGS